MSGPIEIEANLNGDGDNGDNKYREDWKEESRSGGSLREDGVNGWSTPPASVFRVRGVDYVRSKQKVQCDQCMLEPLGVDWLKSSSKVDHVLARPDNRVMASLRRAHADGKGLKSFIFAVNLQVPGREQHSAVFYYVTEDPIPVGSLFYRFVHEDDAFRNARFKLISRIVKGPWIVRATVGNHAACLLGRALTCNYVKGPNYLEIDVDIGSSALASAIIHLALGYVNSVSVDMAFLVESQTEEELPERIIGAVRIAQIDMSSALYLNEIDNGQNHVLATCQGSGFDWRKIGRGLSLLGHGRGHKVEAEENKGVETPVDSEPLPRAFLSCCDSVP